MFPAGTAVKMKRFDPLDVKRCERSPVIKAPFRRNRLSVDRFIHADEAER